MPRPSNTVALVLHAAILVSASGQAPPTGGWRLEVDTVVTPSQPFTEARLYAWFEFTPGLAELFAAARLDFGAPEGYWTWFSCGVFQPCADPPPTFEGGMIRGVVSGQFHFPPHILGNPSNPVLFASARWNTDTFAPRSVRLRTLTSFFSVYRSFSTPDVVRLLPENVVEEEVMIEVRPDCAPDCDSSTGVGVLDIFDFLCFQGLYAAGANYACDCDTGTGRDVCDIFDFLCFQNAFVAGCP